MSQQARAHPLLREPLGAEKRLVGVDLARCLALLGMMAAHMLSDQAADGSLTVSHQLVAGRSSALFAVLAGVSIALTTGRTRPLAGRDRLTASVTLVARAAVVGFLGLVLGGLGSGVAVILTYYAVLFVLALPFLRLGPGPLALLAGLWTVAGPTLGHVVRPLLPENSYAVPSFPSLADPLQLLSELTFTGYYPAVPWLAYLLAGMAIGRLDLRRRAWPPVLLLGGLGVAAGAVAVSRWLTSAPEVRAELVATYDRFEPVAGWAELQTTMGLGLYGTTPTESWWWLAVWGPHSGTSFDLAHTTGSALAVLGLCLLLTRVARSFWQVVAGAGAMTLTLYSLHVAMLSPAVFPGGGLDNYVVQVVLVLVIGGTFAVSRIRGPLEAMTTSMARSVGDLTRTTRTSDGPPAPDRPGPGG